MNCLNAFSKSGTPVPRRGGGGPIRSSICVAPITPFITRVTVARFGNESLRSPPALPTYDEPSSRRNGLRLSSR